MIRINSMIILFFHHLTSYNLSHCLTSQLSHAGTSGLLKGMVWGLMSKEGYDVLKNESVIKFMENKQKTPNKQKKSLSAYD